MSPETALEAGLPPVLLLIGPTAWAAAQRLYSLHETSFSEIAEKLTAESARELRERSFITPWGGHLRVVLIQLDGAAAAAQNILLKLLEEPPPFARFILAGTAEPLGTVVSRCQVIRLGTPLEPEEDPELPRVRQVVATAVRAARDHHPSLLTASMHGWSPEHARQLALWAAETAAGRYQRFSPDFAPGVSPRQALAILTALTAYAGARTASAVALERAFRR